MMRLSIAVTKFRKRLIGYAHDKYINRNDIKIDYVPRNGYIFMHYRFGKISDFQYIVTIKTLKSILCTKRNNLMLFSINLKYKNPKLRLSDKRKKHNSLSKLILKSM